MKTITTIISFFISTILMAQPKYDLSLDELLKQSPGNFASIKGTLTAKDDYGFGANQYTVTRCLAGADKCVLQLSGFDATLKIRLGAEKVSWEEAQRLFYEWHPKIMAIKEWGKTNEWDSREAYKSYASDFKADRNVDGWEKYKDINIQLRTYYFTETEFQVVLTITN